MVPPDDTIVAVASPPGGAARGIVRLSGPLVWPILQTCFRPDPPPGATAGLPSSAGCHTHACVGMPSPHPACRAEAIPGSIRLPGVASPLPCQFYLWPDGRSYTGQPVGEIHTLGSPPLLEAVVRALCAAGARLAEPGEFTLRAFLAGRIDLSQAEAVLGVIDAADPDRFRVALAQLAGGLATPLGRLRDQLVDLLADIEARLDFADEELPPLDAAELTSRLGQAAEVVARLGRQMASRGETAPIVSAVLLGRPNAGKSSLFNALIRREGPGVKGDSPIFANAKIGTVPRERALVSEHPGTTRDYVVAELDLDGVACRLIDTAGVDPGAASESPQPLDEVQQAARAVAAEQDCHADVRILCLDATRATDDVSYSRPGSPVSETDVVVWTKVDAAAPPDWLGPIGGGAPRRALPTSSVTGEGLNVLREDLRRAVLSVGATDADVVAGTAVRCRESVRLAGESLARAGQIAAAGLGDELLASELRVALDQLGQVVGAVYTDDVLDRVFSRFCIGK